MAETIVIRIYRKDAEMLNQYMALVQLAKKQRISIAEAVHEIIKEHVEPIVKEEARERNVIQGIREG